MKHLRRYNESKEKISFDDIRDIFIELEDDYFDIKIDNLGQGIYITKVGGFKYNDVKEALLHLRDYLRPNPMYIDVRTYTSDSMFDRIVFCEFDENNMYGYSFGKKNITDTHLQSMMINFFII